MIKAMFVNLAVNDLARSKAFFEAIGFTFNPQFTDDTAACMVIGDNMYAMLLTEAKFSQFTPKPIADARTSTEVLTALAVDSKAAVDAVMAKALAAGGREPRPMHDHGFMMQRSLEDLDGHIWEIFWMDPAFVQPQPA